MAFTDADLDDGHWCSRLDCVDVLHTLPTYINNDEDELNRNIARSTDFAKATLRPQWPDGWPFSTPSDSLREAVAIRAVYACFRSRALPDELEWLKEEAAAALEFLEALGSGEKELILTSDAADIPKIAVTPDPDWSKRRWGFRHAAGKVDS